MDNLKLYVHTEFKNSETSLTYTQCLRQKHKAKVNLVRNRSNTFKSKKYVARKFILNSGVINWNQALLLNEQWIYYVRKLLDVREGDKDLSQTKIDRLKSLFYKVDLHGAHITINKAKNSCLQNIEGVVLIESKNTFQILEKNGFIKVVPKIGCIFEINLGEYKITCYGEQFAIKPYERFSKKVKKVVPPTEIENTTK